jgi:hypothetical protein
MVWFQARARGFSLLQNMWTGPRAPLLFSGYWGSSGRSMKLTTAPTYINGMHRDSYFYFFSCSRNNICKVYSKSTCWKMLLRKYKKQFLSADKER